MATGWGSNSTGMGWGDGWKREDRPRRSPFPGRGRGTPSVPFRLGPVGSQGQRLTPSSQP